MELDRFGYFKKQAIMLSKCDLPPGTRIGVEFMQMLFPEMEKLANRLEDAGLIDTAGGEIIFTIAASFLLGMMGQGLDTDNAAHAKQLSTVLMRVVDDIRTTAKTLQQAERKPAN